MHDTDPPQSDESDISRRSVLRRGATATITTASVTTTASADEDGETETSEPNQGVLANGLGVEGGDNRAFLDGLFANLSDFTSTPAAETLADRLANEFNANSGAWLEYGNWLIDSHDRVEPMGSVTLGIDVIVTYRLSDDEVVPTTFEADYDAETGEYTDLEWQIEEPDDPHYQVGLRNSAAKYGADDLQEYRRENIDDVSGDHTVPDEEYVSELAGFYAPSMLLGEESKHVLQLLMGDEEGI